MLQNRKDIEKRMTSYPLLIIDLIKRRGSRPRALPTTPRSLRLAFTLLFCLTACTPRFNWREVAINPPGMSVLMPDKPAEMSRKLVLGEHSIDMHMTGARVDERMFAVTVGKIDTGSGLSAPLALERMEQAMLRNIQGKVIKRESALLAPGVALTQLKAQGQAQARPVLMWAWFFEHKGHVVQAVAIGESADEEQAMTFLQSLRLKP